MKKRIRKFLSGLLCVALLTGMIDVSAFAEVSSMDASITSENGTQTIDCGKMKCGDSKTIRVKSEAKSSLTSWSFTAENESNGDIATIENNFNQIYNRYSDNRQITVTAVSAGTTTKNYTCSYSGWGSFNKTVTIKVTVEHDLTHVDAVDPTCTTAGNIEYWECNGCGKCYSDANGEYLVSGGTELPIDSTNHTGLNKIQGKDPTCIEEGNVEYWKCDACGGYFTDENGTNSTTEEAVKRPLAEHQYTYTSDGTTITQGCGTVGCTAANATATISASDVIYDGTPKSATVEVAPNADTYKADTTIAYTKNGETVAADQVVNAGTYTASISAGSVTASTTFTIGQKVIGNDAFEAINGITVTLNPDNKDFNGSSQTVDVTVKDGEKELNSSDYTLSFENVSDNQIVNAGEYTLVITGKGNYTGTIKKVFTVNSISLENADITFTKSPADLVYTGGELANEIASVKLGEEELVKDIDYTVDETSQLTGINAGEYTVTITGKGNYNGSATASWNISKKIYHASLSDLKVTTKSYDGTTDAEVTGEVTHIEYKWWDVTHRFPTTVVDARYTVMGHFDSADAGQDKNVAVDLSGFVVEGNENSTIVLDDVEGDTAIVKGEITKKNITYTVDAKNREYGEVNPAFTGSLAEGSMLAAGEKIDSVTLATTAGTESNVGNYNVTADLTIKNADGSKDTTANYNITVDGTNKLTITKASLNVIAKDTTVVYGEAAPDFEVEYVGFKNGDTEDVIKNTEVKLGLVTLNNELRFTNDYQIGDSAGSTSAITPSWKAYGTWLGIIEPRDIVLTNYDMTFVEGTLEVVAKSIENEDVTAELGPTLTYNGQDKEQKVVVKDGDVTLIEGTDYTLSDNVQKDVKPNGSYTLTITGTGNYTDKRTLEFNIAPKNIADSTVSVAIAEEQQLTYTGSKQTQKVTVTDSQTGSEVVLGEGTDYTLSDNEQTVVGTEDYTLTVTGTGNYTGTTTKVFNIAKADPTITVAPSFTKVYGDSAFALNASSDNTDSEATFTYASSDENVATVDEAGNVTVAGAGKVTITVSLAETANFNAAANATTTITVDKANGILTITNAEFEKTYGDESFSIAGDNIATTTDEGNVPTYVSSNADVVTVDANGQVTVVGVGEATITVSLAASDNYKAPADVTLNITVNQATNAWTTTPSIEGWTYGEAAKTPVYAAKFGDVVVTYKDANGNVVENPTNAGDYTAEFAVVETANYTGLNTVEKFTIKKAAAPINWNEIGTESIVVIKGNLVAGVALPAGWSWKNGAVEVNPGQVVKAEAIYMDTENYTTYTEIVTIVGDVEMVASETETTYKEGVNNSTTIKCTGILENFKKVTMDGKEVDPKFYTTKSGSTILTFTKEFMDSLSAGDHVAEMFYNEGETQVSAKTVITVTKKTVTDDTKKTVTDDTKKTESEKKDEKATDVVNTGDSNIIALWLALALVSMLVVLMAYRKRTAR